MTAIRRESIRSRSDGDKNPVPSHRRFVGAPSRTVPPAKRDRARGFPPIRRLTANESRYKKKPRLSRGVFYFISEDVMT